MNINMQTEYRIAIKLGLVALFFIIRQALKKDKRPKEFSISSTLVVDSTLSEKLRLQPGEQIALSNRPDTFEVVVRAKGIADNYQEIGVIEDRELAENVKKNVARGKIESVNGDNVTLTFTY